ncbi:hypothetical protein glysoja_009219 [Glycine soja]|nr:hypothetical protein glysoja_009219 [Glycine soja]
MKVMVVEHHHHNHHHHHHHLHKVNNRFQCRCIIWCLIMVMCFGGLHLHLLIIENLKPLLFTKLAYLLSRDHSERLNGFEGCVNI